ncbi:hypothetical protein ABT186_18895 [Streptomyces sp. NPDC001634]|uniref:SbtR family transcriptional regulator n=1 Tax=Streptomyces sp. NPDC001634 TaxID=3154390 RepID=UPI00331F1098
MQCDDPWIRFSTFVERICGAMATDRGFSDLVVSVLPTSRTAGSLCKRRNRALSALVRRAQEAGALRENFVPEDVMLFLMANAGVVQVTHAPAPHAWRRLVAFLLRRAGRETRDHCPPRPTPADRAGDARPRHRHAPGPKEQAKG